MTEHIELLPCPFCGNRPNYSASIQDKYGGYCSIYCRICGAGVSGYDTKNSVLKAWNTRSSPVLEPLSDELLEQLSAETHKIYCEQYKKNFGKEYHTGGNYSKLDEPTKDYDRAFVRWAYAKFGKPKLRLPERKEIKSDLDKGSEEYEHGWNACLDAMSEMNKEERR